MLPSEGANTAAFRLKALLLWLRARRGSDEAQQFLQQIGCGRALDHETKPIALLLWVRALAEFERSAGVAGFSSLSSFLAHPNNLGAWSPLLGKAANPSEAYRGLTEESIIGQDSFWRTEEVGQRYWRGVAFPKIELEPEDRRRVGLALKAELEAVPLLFAYPKAKVAFLDPKGQELTFEVTWNDPKHQSFITGIILTLACTCLTGLLLVGLKLPSLEVIKALTVGVFATSLILYFWGREAQQRRELKANRTRILALERASLLSRVKSHEASRPADEPVVAGAYRVEGQIGTGAYASVWSARRLSDGAYVALKLLRTSVAHDPRATDRLRREAEALGMSWHPHVVEVLDHGLLSSGVAYLVMERLKGESLRDRVARLGSLSTAETYELAKQSAAGLNATHRAGIIHRDLKPDHLFYHRTQQGEVVKLLDFGVAWVSWAEIRLTRDGLTVGTRGYAAPEQLTGKLPTPAADLFSLGITLYQALTGIAPPLPRTPSSIPPRSNSANVDEPESNVERRFSFRDAAERLAPPKESNEPMSSAVSIEEASPSRSPLPAWFDLNKVEAPWRPLLARLVDEDLERRFDSAAEFLHELDEAFPTLASETPTSQPQQVEPSFYSK